VTTHIAHSDRDVAPGGGVAEGIKTYRILSGGRWVAPSGSTFDDLIVPATSPASPR
jgi:hypothetical protein